MVNSAAEATTVANWGVCTKFSVCVLRHIYTTAHLDLRTLWLAVHVFGRRPGTAFLGGKLPTEATWEADTF